MIRFTNIPLIAVGIFINGIFISGCEDIIRSGPMAEITDGAFYNALLQNGVDINGNGIISEEEAIKVKFLSIGGKDLKSLDGLASFPNLVELHCGGNNLSNLDVSKNTKLKRLFITNTQISSLDISANRSLVELYCAKNLLTRLDVSNNTALTYLNCEDNQLTNLDVTQNINLLCLSCGENSIVSLDLSNNTKMGDDYYPSYYSFYHEPILNIRNMPLLGQVCVWTTPFPPEGLLLRMDGSPNVYFTSSCSK